MSSPVMLDPAQALDPSASIDADHPAVRAQTRQLTSGTDDPDEVVGSLFAYVRDHVRYDMAPDLAGWDTWRASDTLARGTGFCQQKAVLLAAMLRAAGIPAALSFQNLRSHQIPAHYVQYIGSQDMEVHGLTVAWLRDGWRRIDATLDRRLCARRGYRLTEYRPGAGDILLPPTTLAGEPHFEVIEHLGDYLDVPEHLAERTLTLDYLHTKGYRDMVRHRGVGA